MKEWVYPQAIIKLEAACNDFMEDAITIEEIHKEIQNAEREIVSIDEKWLHTILFNAENEIELLIYTVNKEDRVNLVRPIVKNILSSLLSRSHRSYNEDG